VGIPAFHRQQLLRDMDLPTGDRIAHVAHLPPLYLDVGDDLPRAGVTTRAPYLRLQPRGVFNSRPSCAWCKEYEGECGYHLVRCKQAPIRLRVMRDRALRLIHQDITPSPSQESHQSEANVQRLFRLNWQGRSEWKKDRADKGQQPSQEALAAVLLYMREMVNSYAEAVAGTGQGGSDPVWSLPRYIAAPPALPEEERALKEEEERQRQARRSRASARDSLQSMGGSDSESD
jgi:hypothetical protein